MPNKTTEEIEAIKEKLRANPRTAALADHVKDPNKGEYADWQRKGTEAAKKARAVKKERDARIAEKAKEMAETLEAINSVAQSPQDVMRLLMHEALEKGETDTAFRIAKELGEYVEPKKTRVESVQVTKTTADMTDAELAELAKLEEEFKE